jgi:hypothetical protein
MCDASGSPASQHPSLGKDTPFIPQQKEIAKSIKS